MRAAIAEAADVSPRTVSTYFPSKEGMVFGGYEATVERLRERLAPRAPGEAVVDGLHIEAGQPPGASSVMMRQIADDDVDFARLRQAAIARDPELWALQRRELRALTQLIAAAAAEELGGGPDGLAARVVRASMGAALLELNAHAARGAAATVDSADVVLGFIRAGVRRSRNDFIFRLA